MQRHTDRAAPEVSVSVFADAKGTLEALSRSAPNGGFRKATIDYTHSSNDKNNRLHNMAVAALVGLAFMGTSSGSGQQLKRGSEADGVACNIALPVDAGGQVPVPSMLERLKAMQDAVSRRLVMADHVRRQTAGEHAAYVMLTYETKDKMQAEQAVLGSLALAHGHGDGVTVLTQAEQPTLQISRELYNLLLKNEISPGTPGLPSK